MPIKKLFVKRGYLFKPPNMTRNPCRHRRGHPMKFKMTHYRQGGPAAAPGGPRPRDRTPVRPGTGGALPPGVATAPLFMVIKAAIRLGQKSGAGGRAPGMELGITQGQTSGDFWKGRGQVMLYLAMDEAQDGQRPVAEVGKFITAQARQDFAPLQAHHPGLGQFD
jgi:hypothetical protein